MSSKGAYSVAPAKSDLAMSKGSTPGDAASEHQICNEPSDVHTSSEHNNGRNDPDTAQSIDDHELSYSISKPTEISTITYSLDSPPEASPQIYEDNQFVTEHHATAPEETNQGDTTQKEEEETDEKLASAPENDPVDTGLDSFAQQAPLSSFDKRHGEKEGSPLESTHDDLSGSETEGHSDSTLENPALESEKQIATEPYPDGRSDTSAVSQDRSPQTLVEPHVSPRPAINFIAVDTPPTQALPVHDDRGTAAHGVHRVSNRAGNGAQDQQIQNSSINMRGSREAGGDFGASSSATTAHPHMPHSNNMYNRPPQYCCRCGSQLHGCLYCNPGQTAAHFLLGPPLTNQPGQHCSVCRNYLNGCGNCLGRSGDFYCLPVPATSMPALPLRLDPVLTNMYHDIAYGRDAPADPGLDGGIAGMTSGGPGGFAAPHPAPYTWEEPAASSYEFNDFAPYRERAADALHHGAGRNAGDATTRRNNQRRR